MLLRICFAAVLIFGVPTTSPAQRVGAPVRVRGIAYDSLRRAPLANARITLDARTTITDSHGRFEFDSVVPGTYTISADHAALDSAGFFSLTSRAVIGEGGGEVRIATPSFGTLWRIACQRPPPKDRSLVYGTIRRTGPAPPAADVAVRLTWIDLVRTGRRSYRQKIWAAETRSDYAGTYVVCGVPSGFAVRVQAADTAGASGAIDVRPSKARVYRRDLVIGPPLSDSSQHALLTGVITGPNGEGVPDARLVLNETTEVRSAEDGRFTLAHVPPGTQQLEVFAIGMRPETRVVDILPHDTSTVAFQLVRITTLGAVNVTARRGRILATEFNDRRKSGLAYVMDSTAIGTATQLVNVLAVVPSLSIYIEGAN